MAKDKLKLSLEQSSESAAAMTAEEAKDLADILAEAAKGADALTAGKKEGRVDMEMGDGRISVSVTKVKIEAEKEEKEDGEDDNR